MPLLDALRTDVRFAVRYFGRHKATTAMIVAVLALATGGNAVILSTFQAQFLRPAPAIPKDDSQVRIWARERTARTARWQPHLFTQPQLAALAAHREIFRDIAAFTEEEVVLGGDTTGARGVNAQFVTPNYFGALGVRLVAGPGLRQNASDDADLTAVMAYAIAEQLYGRAAGAVGQRILVNEVPVHIVGVAPPRFQGALKNMDEPALWMPLSARADIDRVSPRWMRDEAALSLFARLTRGASSEHATALARQVVAGSLPDSAARVGIARTADVIGMLDAPPGDDSYEMLIAVAAIGGIGILILLVGWMNVSSLMVAAAVARRHEIAVRLSIGASRARLLRQLITESTLLALTGGAIGLLLAWGMLTYNAKTEIDGVDIAPDAMTFGVVLGIAVVTGVLFGLSPALHAVRGVSGALRDSAASFSARSRLQRGFVIAQIALSQPLLVFLGTMLSLVIADYRPLSPEMSRRVISVRFRPTTTGAPGQRPEAVDSLLPRIAAQRDVVAAVPTTDAFDIRRVVAPDRRALDAARDTVPTIVHMEGAAPGWFALVDMPIVLGRDVSLADTATAERNVVIGSDLARALWGNANPIGRTLASPPLPGMDQDSIALTVVGVYDANVRAPGMAWNGTAVRGSMTAIESRAYTAHGKHWRHDRALVRTRGPAAPYLAELQRFVRERAPSLPVASMETLAQQDERAYRDNLQVAALAGAGGALALLLASLGLYGVVSLAVRQRTREIGIRIAIGAHPARVARMFLASGVRASLIALALGLPLSIVALRIGMSQGIVIAPEMNPYLIGLVIAPVLVAVASAAAWVPARRASRVDPARTLRVE